MAKKTQNEIRNKMVRNSLFVKKKQEKLKEKKKAKKENKNKPKQTPKTIENCRIKDETYIGNIQDDEELQLDLKTDEISKHLLKMKPNDEENDGNEDFSKEDENQYNQEELNENDEETQLDEEDAEEDEDESKDPKILITTTELRISLKTFKLCKELSRVLPNAQYFFRKNVRLTKVIPEAIKRKYSAMIVVNEDNKIPSKLFYFIFYFA